MSRKITSLLVLLTVVLFTLPTQAQQAFQPVKKAKTTVLHAQKANAAKVLKGSKADLQAKKQIEAGVAFPKAQTVKVTPKIQQQVQAQNETKPVTNKRLVSANFNRFVGSMELSSGSQIAGSVHQTPAAPPLKAATETVDAHGIITAPADGVAKVYARSGKAYKYSSGTVSLIDQTGETQIVETEDGTVYIKDIVASYATGAWVKGTKVGNTITVPTKQPVNYNANNDDTLSPHWATGDGTGSPVAADDIADNFTFTIDEAAGTISLQNTNAEQFIAVLWDSDGYYSGNGVFETVYTFSHDYVPPTIVTVTPPASLATETWYANGHTYSSGSLVAFTNQVTVGIDGNDLYVKGIFSNFPDAWIKGTIDGTTVTFSDLQLQGTYGSYTVYATGSDGSALQDFVATYDADAKTITAENFLVANAAEDRLYYLTLIYDVTIMAEEPVIETGANVDVLPYENAFATEDDFAEFGVADANGDGKTWAFSTSNNAYNIYNSTLEADDWLVSPGIKLEAGKKYHFAIDAKAASASYPERLEVKIAAEPKASALAEGQVVIPSTDITKATYETLETLELAVAETGYYHIGIHAISDANQWRLHVANFLVEEIDGSSPAAVQSLNVEPGENALEALISFRAPKLTQDGDAIDYAMTIKILRDGEVIKTFEDVAANTPIIYSDEEPALIGYYTYQVVAYKGSIPGAKSEEKTIFLTEILNVPYTADFSNEKVLEAFTTIDNNNDESTWTWSASNGAYYRYNSTNDADDYLVSSPIHLEAGKFYNAIVSASSYSANYAEKFEVVLGKVNTAEALNQTVIAETEVASGTPVSYDGTFSVEETGEYFVAIHAISEANQFYLKIQSLSIVDGPAATAPAAPDFNVLVTSKGDKSATVKVVAPTKALNGEDLTENLTKIEIFRDGELLTTFEDVAPGATKRYLDEVTADGVHKYQAFPYNADGVGMKTDEVTVFIGEDIPAAIDELKVTGANPLHFSWNKVTEEGANGGYVDPTAVKYNVWTLKEETEYFWTYYDYDELLGTVTDADSFDGFNANEGEQEYKVFAVEPENGKGVGEWTAAEVLVGAPYELPVKEGFAGKQLHYFWLSNADLLVAESATDSDGVAVALTGEEEGDVYLYTGKIDVNNASNPTLLLDVAGSGVSKIKLIGAKDGEDPEVLSEVSISSTAFTTAKVSLEALKGGSYAQVGLEFEVATPSVYDSYSGQWQSIGDYILVDNIRVMDLYQYDLAAAVSAPATVKAGEKATVTATISNESENAAKDYTVVIKAGDKELLNQTVSQSLAPFASKEFTAELETTIFDDAADVTITAEVSYANDLNPDNDAAETVITIKEPTAAQPENVTGVDKGDEGVELSWTAPEATTAEVTETVEGYDDNDNGGLDADVHVGQIGEWTVYDGNGGVYGYGFNGVESNLGNPGSWLVFNPGAVSEQLTTNYAAYSGDKYFISSCVAEPEGNVAQTNKWLISPELPGVAQTISFYTRELVADYGAESYEILASSTDTNPESFTLLESKTTSSVEWEQITVDLPAGTKYFAIRHTSTDVWALLVDDVTYLSGGSDATAFNIYYEGELVATVEGDVTTYTVAAEKIAAGERTFAVSAVYANGQESKPVPVTVEVTTAIQNIIVSDSAPADVYTLDGKLVRQQAKSLDGLKGVYVVNGKAVIVK